MQNWKYTCTSSLLTWLIVVSLEGGLTFITVHRELKGMKETKALNAVGLPCKMTKYSQTDTLDNFKSRLRRLLNYTGLGQVQNDYSKNKQKKGLLMLLWVFKQKLLEVRVRWGSVLQLWVVLEHLGYWVVASTDAFSSCSCSLHAAFSAFTCLFVALWRARGFTRGSVARDFPK